MQKLVNELSDAYILKNQESLLSTTTNNLDTVVGCSIITQAISVCDLVQPVAETQPEPTGDL